MAQLTMILSVLLLTFFSNTLSLPAVIESCDGRVEDFDEAIMHPDLPHRSESIEKSSLMQQRNAEDSSDYWLDTGMSYVAQKSFTADQPQRNIAKNVIFFIGDGMSLTTLAATRVYIGGEERSLSFENFPVTGLAKTYCIDSLVADSACTGTAYLSGIKGMFGTVGVYGHVRCGECRSMQNTSHHVHSIAKWALDSGKSAGFVTTTRVTHATPAGLYAHTSDRNWENDQLVKKACGRKSGVVDVALQLMQSDVGQRLKVVMGGGRNEFVDGKQRKGGKRRDGRQLLKQFQQQDEANVYLETRDELKLLNVSSTKRLMGLFNDEHLLYNLEAKEKNVTQQPSLAEMTAKAVELLAAGNDNGYFLFVEGGKIDKAHHDSLARLAIDETAELSKAVQMAREMTDLEDTLIVVSADHSHTMTYAGYSSRGNDIFGIAPKNATDGLPYLTLSYANGAGFDRHRGPRKGRLDPRSVQKNNIKDVFPSTVPLKSESHGGEDVPVFASGPWAHLFSGVYEQNVIPHIMGFAACIGDGLKACGEMTERK